MRTLLPTVLGLVALVLAPTRALSNGRFPSADYFIAGPGPSNETLVLRTTFGLIVSRDFGRTWGWVCEGAYDLAATMRDPTVAVGVGGRVTVTLPDGMMFSTPDFCTWTPSVGSPRSSVVDVAQDARGATLVAAAGPNGTDDRLLVSHDGGRTWTAGATVPDLFSETVEVAPSDPRRIYLSGFLRGGISVLFRSDDGGMTVREMTRAFDGGQSAFLSAVDPTNPDVVWVRSNLGLGTLLLRSRDGGATFQRVAETRDLMRGFALSDDGATVWYASADRAEGMFRSVQGGPFTRLSTRLNVRCLRYNAGLLFVCADEAVDGFSLGCSADRGDTIDPLLSLRALPGPVANCPGGTSVGSTCPALWPAQQMILRDIDAGPPPTPRGHDAGPDVPDAPAPPDAGSPRDVSPDLVGAGADVGIDVVSDTPEFDRPDSSQDVPSVEVGMTLPPRGSTPQACTCRTTPGATPRGAAWLWGLCLTLLGRRRRAVRVPRAT